MIEFLDSTAVRAATYGVTALLAVWWGVRERRSTSSTALDWWPTYWFMSAILLATLAFGHVSGLGDLLSEIGRDQARSEGWYATRRKVQAVVVAAVIGGWLVGIAVAVFRIPPRRRRYLPHIIALSAIIAFAAIRIVSLHQIDSLLYRRDIGGIRVVSLSELGMLAISILVMVGTARFPRRTAAADGEVGGVGDGSLDLPTSTV